MSYHICFINYRDFLKFNGLLCTYKKCVNLIDKLPNSYIQYICTDNLSYQKIAKRKFIIICIFMFIK